MKAARRTAAASPQTKPTTHADSKNNIQVIILHDAPHVVPITSLPDSWAFVQGAASLVVAGLAFLFGVYSFTSSQFRDERRRNAELFRRMCSDFSEKNLEKLEENTESLLTETVEKLRHYPRTDFLASAEETVEQSIGKFQTALYKLQNSLEIRVAEHLQLLVAAECDAIEDEITPWLNSLIVPDPPNSDLHIEIRDLLIGMNAHSVAILRGMTIAELELHYSSMYRWSQRQIQRFRRRK